MSLNLTAAHSSRIKKPSQQRSSSFAGHARKKPTLKRSNTSDDHIPQLPDHGLVYSLATRTVPSGIPNQLKHIHSNMFDAFPSPSGINSTRTAEILNFRKDMPRTVTTSHLHALNASHTTTERELADLVRRGVVRKIAIPGHGLGRAAIGESLVLVQEWMEMVSQCGEINEGLREKYITTLRNEGSTSDIPATRFTPTEARLLTRLGFLTYGSSSALGTFTSNDSSMVGTLTSLASVGSRAASGSLAAVGGDAAIHDAGGGGGSVFSRAGRADDTLNLSIPNIGPYLRLLFAARKHMLALLCRSQFKEAPLDILRERWDGGVASSDAAGRGRQAIGLPANILPGRTKKWKDFQGLKFRWVLEECLGTGLIELFNTGSVGLGVRVSGS